jgi:hypothetical protein
MARTSVTPLIGATKKRRVTKKRRRRPSVANKMVTVKRTKRRVSGISSELPKAGEMVIAAAAGGFIARIINKVGSLAPKNDKATDYRPYIGVIGGVAAIVMAKNPMIKSAGLGCAAVSAMNLIPDKDIPQIGAVRMIGNKPQIISLSNKKSINRPRLIAGNTTPAMIGKKYNYQNAGGIGG